MSTILEQKNGVETVDDSTPAIRFPEGIENDFAQTLESPHLTVACDINAAPEKVLAFASNLVNDKLWYNPNIQTTYHTTLDGDAIYSMVDPQLGGILPIRSEGVVRVLDLPSNNGMMSWTYGRHISGESVLGYTSIYTVNTNEHGGTNFANLIRFRGNPSKVGFKQMAVWHFTRVMKTGLIKLQEGMETTNGNGFDVQAEHAFGYYLSQKK